MGFSCARHQSGKVDIWDNLQKTKDKKKKEITVNFQLTWNSVDGSQWSEHSDGTDGRQTGVMAVQRILHHPGDSCSEREAAGSLIHVL